MSDAKIEYSYWYDSFTEEYQNDYLSIGYAFTKEKFYFVEKVKSRASLRWEYYSDWEVCIDLDLKQLKPRNFKQTHLTGFISNYVIFYRQQFGNSYFKPDELKYIAYARNFSHPWMSIEHREINRYSISATFQQWLLKIGLSFNIKTNFYDDHEAFDIDSRRGYIAKPIAAKEE